MKKFGVLLPNLLVGILSLLLGIFLIAGDTDILTKLTFIFIGIFMIATNIIPLIESVKRNFWYEFAYRLILVIFGICFIFYHNTTLCIIVGLLFIILPIIKISIAEDKKNEFKNQLLTLIIGFIILLVSPDTVIKALYVVLGVVLIAFGLFAIISSFYTQKEIK
jgi:uncharacterized membrane protein HdeD (DUF308 family)